MKFGICKHMTTVALAALGSILIGSWCFASSFTADMVMKQRGMTVSGKLSVSGKKTRQDMTMGNRPMTTIVRADKGVTWMLDSQKKQYMEMPGTRSLMPDDKAMARFATKKDAGTQKINGYVCKKTVYTPRANRGPGGTITMWVSQKLQMPLKMEMKNPQGTMSMECKNIQEKKVSDALFELPKGYKKMQMQGPPMGGRRPGGMRPHMGPGHMGPMGPMGHAKPK